MKRALSLLLPLTVLAWVATPASASLFLSDWGVSYGNWDPVDSADMRIRYYTEDWDDDNENGWLDPGYGGDLFDVEAVYFGMDEAKYYFAVVTGFRPEGSWGYSPGDLMVDFGNDGSWDFAFDIDQGGAMLTQLTSVEDTAYDWENSSNPYRVAGYDGAPMPVQGYRYGEFSGRYAIEAMIDRGSAGKVIDFRVHWTMEGGNDAGDLVDSVPEPATVLLLGAGLLGAAASRIRRKR
jgi:hypothetical protein